MLPIDERALCVAIHDVAPENWADCARLAEAVRAVADIPLSWLVVPRFHGSVARSADVDHALGAMLARGHELVLHGYTHRDMDPIGPGLYQRFLRTVYTEGEGEFSAIGAAGARRKIEQGLAWFRARGWPVSGFVAPAWLLGRDAWPVLSEFPFAYTTTISHLHLLRPHRALLAPSLVYTARNRTGRLLSPALAGTLAALLQPAPLVRLALHPRDARHPALLRHAQRLVERLLDSRAALTKAAFVRAYQYGPQAPPNRQCERP